MKLKILNLDKTETGSIDLPNQFYEDVRPDLIEKAFLVIQSNNIQPYGSDPEAGKKSSAELSRRRKKYRGSYGFGISRVPRKILSRRGTRFVWVGAFAPGTVGGRRAHPPKVEKVWSKNINKKERRKAICSAIAATLDLNFVKNRGHIIPNNYPFIISDEIVKIEQTKKLKETLNKIGFENELQRAKRNSSKGLLLVTSNKNKITTKSFTNIPGFEVVNLSNLNVELLAPGGVGGRMTVFTKSAIEELKESQIFTSKYQAPKVEKISSQLKSENVQPKEKPKVAKPKKKEESKSESVVKKTKPVEKK